MSLVLMVANGPCQHCYYLLEEHLPDKKCLFSHTMWRPFPDQVILNAVSQPAIGTITTIKFYHHEANDKLFDLKGHWYDTRSYRRRERDPLLTRIPLDYLMRTYWESL